MNNLLYDDGERFIIEKKHLEELLNDSIKIMQIGRASCRERV